MVWIPSTSDKNMQKYHVTRSCMNKRCDCAWQYRNLTNGFCNDGNSKASLFCEQLQLLQNYTHVLCNEYKFDFASLRSQVYRAFNPENELVQRQMKNRSMRGTQWMTSEPKLRCNRFTLPHFMIAFAQHIKAPGSNWIPYISHIATDNSVPLQRYKYEYE